MKPLNKLLTIFILLLTASFTIQAQRHSITVQGTARVPIENTKSTIRVTMETVSPSPNDSIAENTAKSNAVLDAILGTGIDENDIQTSEFIFTPVFMNNSGVNEITGYKVTNSLKVTINDNDTIGTLLDLLIEAGASRIDRVTFNADNIDTFKNQALLMATEKAKSQALILAKASSLSLGKVIRIDATNEFSRNGVGAAAASGVPIIAGSQDIVATVTIEYAIY